MKILVVDRNEDLALTIRLGLSEHNVTTATTLVEALVCVEKVDYDSCLIDLGISGGGTALLAQLNAAALATHGHAIRHATAWAASVPEDWNRQQAKFECFLLKPTSLEHICAALHGECCPSCGLSYHPDHRHLYCVPQTP